MLWATLAFNLQMKGLGKNAYKKFTRTLPKPCADKYVGPTYVGPTHRNNPAATSAIGRALNTTVIASHGLLLCRWPPPSIGSWGFASLHLSLCTSSLRLVMTGTCANTSKPVATHLHQQSSLVLQSPANCHPPTSESPWTIHLHCGVMCCSICVSTSLNDFDMASLHSSKLCVLCIAIRFGHCMTWPPPVDTLT